MAITLHPSGKITNSAGVNLTPTPMVDHWRMTNDSADGVEGTLTAWNQISTSNHFPGRLGSSMSISSGVWTFPDTGIYNIISNFAFFVGSTNDLICQVWLRVSYDGGSNWNTVQSARFGADTDSVHATIGNSYVLDVTDTSLVKIKFETDSFSSDTELRGDADEGETNVTIIRLGDT